MRVRLGYAAPQTMGAQPYVPHQLAVRLQHVKRQCNEFPLGYHVGKHGCNRMGSGIKSIQFVLPPYMAAHAHLVYP
eukprot:11478089-Ditylum_brightwellii.AAC.1